MHPNDTALHALITKTRQAWLRRWPDIALVFLRLGQATGISLGIGSASSGSSGEPSTSQSFASVDICRYNLPGGNILEPARGMNGSRFLCVVTNITSAADLDIADLARSVAN